MIDPFFGPSKLYVRDIQLLKSLKATSARSLHQLKLPHGTRVEVALVQLAGDHQVDVYLFCTAWPAQFWDAEVAMPDKPVTRLSFGSGSLTQYWPIIETYGLNMFTVETLR